MSAGLASMSDDDLLRAIGRPPAAGRSASQAPAAPPPGLSGLSDADLMRQLGAARREPSAAPARPETGPASFDERFGETAMSPATDGSSDPLAKGMRRTADERLIGPPSARNTALAGLYEAGSGASLNAAGNAAAGIATLVGQYDRDWAPMVKNVTGADTRVGGYNPNFSENRQLFDEQRAALARQSPKAALAGTVGGIVGGAVALPGLAGAPAATLAGRARQAAITGGLYGGAAEALDSFDPVRAATAGGIGAVGGAVLSPVIETLAPHVVSGLNKAVPFLSRLVGRGGAVASREGGFTPEAEAALREIGLDPASLPPEFAAQMQSALAAKGASPAVAREAAAAEFGVPLSRGQATADPRALAVEAGALSGGRGARAKAIGDGFATGQTEAISKARTGLFGLAGRGEPPIDNPAVGFEAVADRARRAADEGAAGVGAAQRVQDEALQAVRPGSGDALDAAAAIGRSVRDEATAGRALYGAAYGQVGEIEGRFAPGALSRTGERVRGMLGPDTPISPTVTPAASQALAMLDDIPQTLGLRPGEEPTAQQIMLLRKGMSSLYGSTGQNGTDRHALGEVVNAFDRHLEDLFAIGQFRRGPALPDAAPGSPGRAAEAAGDLAAPPDAITLPAAPQGAPESLTRYLARNGGIPLDDEARAADLNRLYVPGGGTLARRGAPTWDDLRVRLHEDGFFPGEMDGASARDVADRVREAIRAERQGRPTFRMEDEAVAGARRGAGRVADENAGHAADVDREARKLAIDLEGFGISGSSLDRAALMQAAEARVLGHADDGIAAYEQAVSRGGDLGGTGASTSRAADDVPFPGLGEGTGVPTSDALPIGDTGPADAMRRARGLFSDHKRTFSPRGAGDDAGRAIRNIVERDAQPAEIASMLFGSITRPGETGLSVRLAERLRDTLGPDSPALTSIQQGLIARVLDGPGDLGRRLDGLLTGNGRDAASKILTAEQVRGLEAFRAAMRETDRAMQATPPWIADLSRLGFDPNQVASSLFGAGVPGARVGSSNFARGLKSFLGEGSSEWSGLRQAALQQLTQPGGRGLDPAKEAARVSEFTAGRGAGLARELFTPAERSTLDRYAATLRSTVLPNGEGAANGGRARVVAEHMLTTLLAGAAFAKGGPTMGGAMVAAKPGSRLLSVPGTLSARHSFLGGAPRAPMTQAEFPGLTGPRAAVAAALALPDMSMGRDWRRERYAPVVDAMMGGR